MTALGQRSSLTRRWLLGVVPVLLAITAWWCYTDGTVTRADRVTVTRSSMMLDYVPPSAGNARIGRTPGAWLTRYRVECMTPRGEPCWIEVSQLIDSLAYREGELISAEATFRKPHGIWAWTDWGRFFAWLSVAAVAIGGLLIGRKVRRVAPAELPLAPDDRPTAALAPGSCALTSKAITPQQADEFVAPSSTGPTLRSHVDV